MVRLIRSAVAHPTVACILLASCASMQEYRNPSDPCASYREPLISAQEKADKTFTTGAAISAGLGTLAGLACSAAGGKPAACAGAGGGVMALGTGISYWLKKRQEARTTVEMRQAIDGLADEQRSILSPLASAIHNLNQCRMQEIAALQEHFLRKQIEKAAAESSLNVVDSAIDKDQELINKLIGGIDARATELAQQKADTLEISLEHYVAQEKALPPLPQSAAAAPKDKLKAAQSQPSAVRPASVKPPMLQTTAKPPRTKTADATADLYYDAKAVTLLQKQQAQELADASSSVRRMLEITGAQLPLNFWVTAQALSVDSDAKRNVVVEGDFGIEAALLHK